MFCLKCFHWWPIGSRYCGVCQRPMNARLCSKEHVNPLWGPQQSCTTCNLPLLQQGVPALGMAWLARGLAILLLLWLGYQAILHLGAILGVVGRVGAWLLCLVLCHIPAWCYRLVKNLLVYWIGLYLLSYLLPKEIGGPFRGWLLRCGQSGLRLAGSGAKWLGKGIAGLFQAAARATHPKEVTRGRQGRSGRDDEERDA